MSLRTALQIVGLASARPPIAVPPTEGSLARTLATCAAALKCGSSHPSIAQQRDLLNGCTAALPLRAPVTAVTPLISSQSSCKRPACVSSSLPGVRRISMHSAGSAWAHAAAGSDSRRQGRAVHTSAASRAAQAARAAPDDMLAGASGDPELMDMMQPELLQTPGGQIAYHALPATGSHLTGVIYCGGEVLQSSNMPRPGMCASLT